MFVNKEVAFIGRVAENHYGNILPLFAELKPLRTGTKGSRQNGKLFLCES